MRLTADERDAIDHALAEAALAAAKCLRESIEGIVESARVTAAIATLDAYFKAHDRATADGPLKRE